MTLALDDERIAKARPVTELKEKPSLVRELKALIERGRAAAGAPGRRRTQRKNSPRRRPKSA
jgi:hypothetical protein